MQPPQVRNLRPCPVCNGSRTLLFLLMKEINAGDNLELVNKDGGGKFLPIDRLEVECVDCGTSGQVECRDPATLTPSSNLAPLHPPSADQK